MATIEIFMLGNFEIRVDGQPVLAQLSQSRKATALVQYLVLQRGAPVPHKVLIDTLWGGERCANPDMALRAILHRFRSMISQEQLTALESCILTSRGCYQWNPNLACTVDVFQLEDLAAAAEQCEDPDKRLEHYQQIETLYRGRLLPLSASEPWVEGIAMHLHAYYRTAMLALLEHYRKQGDSERLVALCERGLEKNPRVERLYLELIMALEDLGRHSDAQLAARRGRAAGCLHHAIEPRQAATAWRQARKADRNMENDMARLITALPDQEADGAMLCSFETFGEIYRMQRGLQAQYGVPIFLALLTLTPTRSADAGETERMMTALGELIHTGMRRCDVAARYSDTQYALLMCGTGGGDSAPLEHIKQAFYRIPTRERYLMNYRVCAPRAGQNKPRARRARAVRKTKGKG